MNLVGFFFFKQKTAYEMRISDWSSDVCSSDLVLKTRKIEEIMFTSINPATGEKIGVYEELTSAEIEAKLNKAASTFQQWRTTTLSARAELLGNIADQFDTNKDRLARMATPEMGKTYASAIAEVEKCVAGFRNYARNGPAMLEIGRDN